MGRSESVYTSSQIWQDAEYEYAEVIFEIGADSKLFEGPAITKEVKFCEEYMGKFSVVFISLKDIDGVNYQEAEQGVVDAIMLEASRLEALHNSEALSDIVHKKINAMMESSITKETLKTALRELTRLLCKHYGQKVIFPIDEYDVPWDKAYQSGYYLEMAGLIRSMFSSVLKTNDSLYFTVMTGLLFYIKREK